ncbi:unnamed protein product, partial [Prunus brigantina]
QLLACQLGGLGTALRLPLNLECSVMITQKLTSSQPRSHFLTANLGDYCLHHNQPSISSLKASSTKGRHVFSHAEGRHSSEVPRTTTATCAKSHIGNLHKPPTLTSL